MSYEVKGQTYFDVIIDGKSLAATNRHIKEMLVVENVIQHLPTFKLRVLDQLGGSNDQQPIYDGCPVELILGYGSEKDQHQKMNFRVLGSRFENDKTEPAFSVTGYLDYPKYLFKIGNGSFGNISSSEAISRIAELCDLTPNVDNTSDKQIWLTYQKNYANWASSICDHGWVDDRSCMFICVNARGELFYKNLTNITKNKPKAIVYYGEPPENSDQAYEIIDLSISNASGANNAIANYGSRLTQERINGDFSEHENVQATKLSNNLEINSDLKRELNLTNSRAFNIDCGNTHDNFAKAFHQNQRLKKLYVNNVSVMFDVTTNIDILDLVELRLVGPGSYQPNTTYGGPYIVSAKSRLIGSANRYFEKLVLTSTGRNLDPQNKMV